MEGDMSGLEFMMHVRKRRRTLRRNLKTRIKDENYPEADDKELRELALLRAIARLLNMPLEMN